MFETIDVFKSGDHPKYLCYRLPSLVVSARGTVLAVCEARRTAGGDWAGIDLLLRRSFDGGRTWREPQLLVKAATGEFSKNPLAAARNLGLSGEVTLDNPVLIADRDGSVHFLYCVEYMRCFYMRSDDEGATFTPAVEITAAFSALHREYPWQVLAVGPGHGIQLDNGRLLAPIWISPATGENAHHPSVASTLYSDDHGQTWHCGRIAIPDTPEWVDPNEGTAVQLADGRVLLNVRTESSARRRLEALSPDGIGDWSRPEFHDQLLEPICAASILRLSSTATGCKDRLLFVNPHNLSRVDGQASLSGDRKDLTVKLSYDEGRSWPVGRTVDSGYGGYSDLAALADGTILCLYEGGDSPAGRNLTRLALARFDLEWLTDGADSF